MVKPNDSLGLVQGVVTDPKVVADVSNLTNVVKDEKVNDILTYQKDMTDDIPNEKLVTDHLGIISEEYLKKEENLETKD